ncbi:tail fiber protein [Escherichia phage Lindwurm]|uniref:Tail fiber protein n=1 Tax=Escherichia phage Lindwurm TaxID=2872674 RepID=A0AC61TN03_9CAUD|nr:tail fiber protein [Escherichia phage Lindwurm]
MTTYTSIPQDITKLKNESLNKNNNLSDLADRAAAWLNVRPIGSTPLAGDPVNDYDAVTKRWVENKINTGTVGPTMNGVMNYGVGDFHLRDSRAYIQPYEVVSDGQLLNRADWPELWAYAQMVGAISDDIWVSDTKQRGKYSTGDGTTTFRVPDRNGVQLNSIKGLFARGDGGGDAGQAGSISEAAAPNITGSFPGAIAGAYESAINVYSSQKGLPGALNGENGLGVDRDGLSKSGTVPAPDNTYGFSFDASRADPVYGRYGITGTIIPNNFIGVWVIRASGGFVAANTSWSVKNADKSAPPLGTVVRGGEVVSEYSNPESKKFARLYSSSVWGSPNAAVVESQGADMHPFRFYENGNMDFRKSGHGNALGMYSVQVSWDPLLRAGTSNLVTGGVDRVSEGAGSDIVVVGYSLGAVGPTGYPTKVGFHQYMPGSPAFGSAVITVGGDNNNWARYFFDITGQIYGATSNGEFSYTRNGVSDERVKHDISPVGVDKSYSNIQGLEFVKFVYNNDEQERVRHGVIAQQAETVEPLYVKTRKYVGINPGEVVEQKELDTTPMLLDTMHVVQVLMQRIESMEAEIAELKASK